MHTPHRFQREIPGWTLNPTEACRTAAISLYRPQSAGGISGIPRCGGQSPCLTVVSCWGRWEAVQWHQRAHTHLGQGHQMGRPRGPGRVTH